MLAVVHTLAPGRGTDARLQFVRLPFRTAFDLALASSTRSTARLAPSAKSVTRHSWSYLCAGEPGDGSSNDSTSLHPISLEVSTGSTNTEKFQSGGGRGCLCAQMQTPPALKQSQQEIAGCTRDGRWTATSIGSRGAGGQDRPARRSDGPQPDLRRGLSGLLLWVPAGAQPA